MSSIKIEYNEPGMRQIMTGHGISQLEQQIMMQKCSQIRGEFLTHFGYAGKFEVKCWVTSGGPGRRYRLAFKVHAADARTTAALKKEPGWLAKFL